GGAVIHALRAQDGAGEGVTVREVRQSGLVQARVGAAGEEAAGVMVMAGDAQVADVRGIRMAEEGDGAHGEAAAVGHRQGRGVLKTVRTEAHDKYSGGDKNEKNARQAGGKKKYPPA
ncbi:TPA: hypothetical protein VGT10_004991, partial [Enterobacter cloacae]|nr:hypothetical protein [Enterobacter cloacae]